MTTLTLAGSAAPLYGSRHDGGGNRDDKRVQWAERTQGAGTPANDEAKWPDRLHRLQPIRFCPIVPGEPAPYPSCVSKG